MLGGLFGSSDNKSNAKDTPRGTVASARRDTTIGDETFFTGTLYSKGNIRIGGMFKGSVTSEAYVLVGEGATIEGDLVSETAVIAGTLKGDVTATRVAIRGSGRVQGDIRVEQLVSDDGSYVRGVITMEDTIDIEALIAARRPEEAAPAPEPKAADTDESALADGAE